MKLLLFAIGASLLLGSQASAAPGFKTESIFRKTFSPEKIISSKALDEKVNSGMRSHTDDN